MPISSDLEQVIKADLEADRLDYEEIAAIRLGDPKKKYVISGVAKKYGLSRKDRRGKHRKSCSPKVGAQKHVPVKPLKITTFRQKTRLELIDEAITIHKSLLESVTDPYKMDKWSAALERLLNQRREEEPSDPDDTDDDGYLEAVRGTAKDDWNEEASALQVEAPEQETAPGNELVDA